MLYLPLDLASVTASARYPHGIALDYILSSFFFLFPTLSSLHSSRLGSLRFDYSTLFAIAIFSFAMLYALCLPMISSRPARSIFDYASSDAFAFALRLPLPAQPTRH
jgi:hypothetical protein